MLGGPARDEESLSRSEFVPIARLQISAAAGQGKFPSEERKTTDIAFWPRWLQQLSGAKPSDLSIIQVEGDSMTPTLSDGDEIMVDLSAAHRKPTDGIYVLRRDDALLVKRLSLHPSGKSLTIASDNPAYASWTDCLAQDVHIIGRVVWAGRRIR